MLYLNDLKDNLWEIARNLTLTNVVFELRGETGSGKELFDLTLTNVVFEFYNLTIYNFMTFNLTLTNVVFEYSFERLKIEKSK